MKDVDITIEICGMSGDGTIAAGVLLNAALSAAGLNLLAFDSYPAEIRGFGRCVTHSRAGTGEILALTGTPHVLISLDDLQSQSRIPFLEKNATILFDNRPASYVPEDQSIAAHVDPETRLFGAPFGDLASQAGGSTRGKNLVALGAFAGLFSIAPEFFNKSIDNKFSSKGEMVLKNNLKCFEAGYEYVKSTYMDRITNILQDIKTDAESTNLLLSGNEAIAQGALAAGLKNYFGYPITPATPVMEYLAKALPKTGGGFMQMEDEISSIGAVIGSFFAGKRAMTATSGPGFALMTELIGHAVMTETPAVVVNAQRGGPATGLPTKTEQSDLQAAVFGGPGDSARIVIAPTNVSECFHHIVKSFQLAEKYQTPVIVLTDFFLHNRVENITPLKAAPESLADGNVYPEDSSKDNYRRFEITDTGISPRSIPGTEGFLFSTSGLEQTEAGVPDYTPDNHEKMTEKRHRKIWGALNDLPAPIDFSSENKLDVGVIAWGSTFGAALEASRMAQKKGMKIGALKIQSIYPYHVDEILGFMERCKEILIPELNYEGQLANLIGHLHHKCVYRLNRATGKPIPAKEILEKIQAIYPEP